VSDEPTYEQEVQPKYRAMSIPELRGLVKARHKMLCGIEPFDEAVQLIRDEYHANQTSAEEFVEWIRGAPSGEPPTKGALERRHWVADPRTGEQHQIQTQPGSIPPRPI